MDGGSSLSIIYLETLNLLGIKRSQLKPSAGGFHGVLPGKKDLPVGQIDLPVYFGIAANFRKKILIFEVASFRGTYHTIIGRPGYAKFMAVPNYTYLKLEMPGPKGITTISSSYAHAYECDIECVKHGGAIESSAHLASMLEALTTEAQEPRQHVGSFKPAKGTKKIALDPNSSDDKVLTISATLNAIYEAMLIYFLSVNADMFVWSPLDMPGVPREVAKHTMEIQARSKPMKQRLCCFDEEKHRITSEEVHKHLVARFIKEVHQLEWLANPVLVKKKNGKMWTCVDYNSLNKACLKVPFSLPCIDQIVDSIVGCETLSFLDAYSSYHQIKMKVWPACDFFHYPFWYVLLCHHALRPLKCLGNILVMHAPCFW